MRLLLDTHIVLWAVIDHPRLSRAARALIDDQSHPKFVSVISIWEVALKRASKPVTTPATIEQVLGFLHEAGVALLPLMPGHVDTYSNLPSIHRDPFDRMIVAQALEEPLRLITHDKMVARYSDTFILV